MTRTKWLLGAALAAMVGITAPAAAQPVFRYGGSADVETMDPAGRFEIFTLSFLHAIYEPLLRYDRDLKLEPALATAWTQVDPLTWRFTLRQGVKFQDGSPFTAGDVVFTITRGKAEGSAMIPTLAAVKEAVAIDPATVEIRLGQPSPTLLNDLAFVLIMSQSWAEANQAAKPTNLRANQLSPAHFKAMGTGPFALVERKPDERTELAPNPDWWDKPAKPLPKVSFRPVKAGATRVAALLSGELDLIDPVPLQDVPRVQSTAGFKVAQRAELRTMFLGMDQFRDELLESSVKGRNPFKDIRVRRAFYQAIDVNAIKERVMRGAADPTGSMIAPPIDGYDPSLETRLPLDVNGAKALLAEAGYPEGFAVGMDCPNDRWVNDEAVCQAVVAMLARIGVKVNLNAQNRGLFLNKVLKQETSFYLLGWTPGNNDALDVLKPLMLPRAGGVGFFNIGGWKNDEVIALTRQIETETDPARRKAEIVKALGINAADIGYIPLYRQYVTWGMAGKVEAVQRADGVLPLWQVHLQ
ncbi:MAG: ABC transporter substrate-binding protein [Ferrovibrionaceae bacterium]